MLVADKPDVDMDAIFGGLNICNQGVERSSKRPVPRRRTVLHKLPDQMRDLELIEYCLAIQVDEWEAMAFRVRRDKRLGAMYVVPAFVELVAIDFHRRTVRPALRLF